MLLLGALGAGGCWGMVAVKLIKDASTTVSVRVEGDEADLVNLVDGLIELQGGMVQIQALSDALDGGFMVLEIAGTYADVLDTLRCMAGRGLRIIGNDPASRALVETALICALKAGG